MNYLHFLIELSENDKRILIAFFIALIFILALLGYLIKLYVKLLKRQARRVDTMMYDLVKYKIIEDEKHFKKVAFHKSRYYFFKKAWISVMLMTIALVILFTYCMAVRNASIAFLFSKEEGFPTLFFIFDWSKAPRSDFFGINLISGWAPILVTESGRRCVPTFMYNNVKSWISYIVVPLFLTGFIWFMFCVQGLLARAYRINKSSLTVYQKNLDNLNPNNGVDESTKTAVPPAPPANQNIPK